MKKKQKKKISRAELFTAGKIMGMRKVLEILCQESAIELHFMAWLIEEWVLREHKDKFK